MYLIDTNILLEFLLDQQRADEVETFLHTVPKNLLYLSDSAYIRLEYSFSPGKCTKPFAGFWTI